MPTSASGEALLNTVANGGHVSSMTQMARAIQSDLGTECPAAVNAIASLGGSHQSNAERDMHKWLKNVYDSQLELYWLELPVHVQDKKEMVTLRIPVLIPFEVMHGTSHHTTPNHTTPNHTKPTPNHTHHASHVRGDACPVLTGGTTIQVVDAGR